MTISQPSTHHQWGEVSSCGQRRVDPFRKEYHPSLARFRMTKERTVSSNLSKTREDINLRSFWLCETRVLKVLKISKCYHFRKKKAHTKQNRNRLFSAKILFWNQVLDNNNERAKPVILNLGTVYIGQDNSLLWEGSYDF